MPSLLLFLAVLCTATILLEAVPVLLVKDRKAWWKAGLVCNVVTNPVLNVVMLLVTALLTDSGFVFPVLMVLELTVVFLEAWLYRLLVGKPYLHCLAFSLVANAVSFGAGILLDRAAAQL